MKNPPPSAGDTRDSGSQVRFLGGKDPLEEEIAIHSSILAWKTSWTEEPVQATVHGITKSHTRLNTYTHTQHLTTAFCFHCCQAEASTY